MSIVIGRSIMQMFWHIIGSNRFKALLLIGSSCMVVLFFLMALYLFRPADSQPDLQLIDMNMRKEIRDFASVVKTGMYIKNFEVFDITNDHFLIGAVVWFEFFTDEVMLDVVQDFSFVNGKILEKTPGDIRINGPTMFIKYDLRIEFKSELSYYRYPFDDHRVSLVMTNNSVAPNEMYFTIENSCFSISPDVYTGNWKILELDTAWGYFKLGLDSRDESKKMMRPSVAYSINFEKSSIRNIIIIFVPMFIALLFGLLTFIMGLSNTGNRMKMCISGLTALLSYRFIIDRMIPAVGYLTTTDLVYILYLLILLVIFVLQLVLGLYNEQARDIPPESAVWLQKVHDVTFLLCAFSFVGYSAYVLLW